MDLLRTDLPEVVLTDLDMPVMDGLELVQTIRRDYPARPGILMTAMGSQEVDAKPLPHGGATRVGRGAGAEGVRRTDGPR